MRLARQLIAPAPGWTTSADVVVVGSGIAGLTTALRLRRRVDRVLLVTKTVLDEGSTRWAQGGIAAALDPADSPTDHRRDTLVAGAGVCDEAAVTALVTEGPARVRELVALGAEFDRTPDGRIALTREGGHHRDRIAHAGGDATGREISRALIAALDAVVDDPGIEVIEHAMVVDLLQDGAFGGTSGGSDRPGRVCGVTVHVLGEGQRDGVGAVLARAVVLATGGIGQVYASTTNPAVATGDGMAAAVRAGAAVRDLEFVQFHPTVLWLGAGSIGQQPLISEAVRGEGAVLVDDSGERFMPGVHELADLAPRDVVSRAIVERMRRRGVDHVYLDARGLGAEFLERRFPSIVRRCRSLGFDPATQLLPVAPAQHYASGGVATDLHGRSSLAGLYACGEVACSGVHGANRLASNSLLEGLVFAGRIADDLSCRLAAGELPPVEPAPPTGGAELLDSRHQLAVQRAMTAGAGALRSAESLQDTAIRLAELPCARVPDDEQPAGCAGADSVGVGAAAWETTNLHLVGSVLTTVAVLREETRGGHLRADFPERDDLRWRGHLTAVLGPDGELTTSYSPIAQPVAAW
ncbi:MAG: L-aspartate oxidase [Angustibacter sp.]